MSTPSQASLIADRRWFIGVSISVAFGLFGAVMALLSYAGREKSEAPRAAPAANAPAAAAAPTAAPAQPTPKGHGKGRNKD